MVILNLKLDNILCFKDFEINFSYPKKLKNTLIKDENLLNYPSFRYKKLNVFIGSNASGKTSLIRCLWRILIFLRNKEKKSLLGLVNNKDKKSYIELDYALDYKNFIHTLNKIKISIDDEDVLISHNYINLTLESSYETRIAELESMEDNFEDYLTKLEKMDIFTGWNIALPATEKNFQDLQIRSYEDKVLEDDYLYIMNSVLSTLDPSIIEVTRSNDAKNALVIKHLNIKEKIIVQDGVNLHDIPFLSSGTKYGFNIANMIFSIKHHMNTIYFIDEQFSYVDSDLEARILSIMVSLLGPNEQIFYTTHNKDILELRYPFHSFYFLKKEKYGDVEKIIVNCASEIENRNNVSPKSIIDNDSFATSRNPNKIFDIVEKIHG